MISIEAHAGLALLEACRTECAEQLRAFKTRVAPLVEALASAREERAQCLLSGRGESAGANDLSNRIAQLEHESATLSATITQCTNRVAALTETIVNVRAATAANDAYAAAMTARQAASEKLGDAQRALVDALVCFSRETLPRLLRARDDARAELLVARQRLEQAALACGQRTVHPPMPELTERGAAELAVALQQLRDAAQAVRRARTSYVRPGGQPGDATELAAKPEQ